jgi:L-threonylcarbamoyladenylate synthase
MSSPLQTLHLYASQPDDIIRAGRLLREGGLVAFATETVYGLGANALSADAVAGVFRAKQRPSWDPLIVHLASVEQVERVAEVPAELKARIAALAAAFWPGPLTLLLPRKSAVPDAVTAGRPLVGVRVPAHPAAQALLMAAGVPIAAPSANLFGHTSPTTAKHVLSDLAGAIDAVLDAGPTTVGVESTVVDPTQTPMVLYRPGAVTAAELAAVTGIPVKSDHFRGQHMAPASLPSPGVGIRHYAPRAVLVLTGPTAEELWNRAAELAADLEQDEWLGVMLPTGWLAPPRVTAFAWGPWNDAAALAVRVFAGLRELDDRGVTTILCPLPEPGGLGDALRDRLQKAARKA